MRKNKLSLIVILLFFLVGCGPQSSSVKTQISEKSVLVFVYEAIILSAYNYNFVKYESQLQSAEQYFTPDAWKAFKQTFDKSAIKNKMVVYSVPIKPPVILNESIENGKQTWKIQMPILVTYENKSTSIRTPLTLNMKIVQTSSNKLVIEQFIVT